MIQAILDDKSLKGKEKRTAIIDAYVANDITEEDLLQALTSLPDKQKAFILEVFEETTNKKLKIPSVQVLQVSIPYITHELNAIKREASRIIGNLAAIYPDDISQAIDPLLLNTRDEGTVVRWGSAYAFAKIIVLPEFAKGDLYDKLVVIAGNEEESGVKNQYLKSLKKADKLRK